MSHVAAPLPKLYGDTFAACPQDAYNALRAAGPIAWAEIAEGVTALVVTGYQAAIDLATHPELFSKSTRRWAALIQGKIPQDSPVVAMMAFPSLLYKDGQDHARLRTAMDDCLARIDPHRLREITRRRASDLINRIAPRGQADLMADFADRVPLLVFADLLGYPEELVEPMVTACQGMANAGPEAAQAFQDVLRLLAHVRELKTTQPGRDITSWFLSHPARLTAGEIDNQNLVVIGAGTIPIAAWIGNGLRLLTTDEGYIAKLAGGSVTVRRALEQVLWTHAPMANFSVHYAVTQVEFHNCTIPPGVPILISHAAANTDPALPEHLGYDSHAHLAWSAGPHQCPAVSMATTITETAVETALDRLWDLQLTLNSADIPNRHGPFHQCPHAMFAAFRPQPARRTPAADPTDGGRA